MSMEPTGVGDTIVRVADDTKAYAAAQVALYKAIALSRWRQAQSGLIFGVIALALAMSAFGALLVGLIFSLTPLVGPFGATAIVIGLTFAIAAILGVLAGKKLARAFGGGE